MKFVLDIEDDELLPSVWGLRSGLEDYALAFRFNSSLAFRLKRNPRDLEVRAHGLLFRHSLYTFADQLRRCRWQLVANRPYESEGSASRTGGLFDAEPDPVTPLLSQDKRKPDYLLLLWDEDSDQNPAAKQNWGAVPGVQAWFPLAPKNLPVNELLISPTNVLQQSQDRSHSRPGLQ